MTKPKTKLTDKDYQKLGEAIESALVNDYINWLGNTRRQMFSAFVRGVCAGLGTVIGATLVVALLVGILSAIGDAVPVIGPLLEDTSNQIQQ